MQYEPQDFKHLLGTPGMSDRLLMNHFTLYEGYVKNVNAIGERAQTIEPGTPESSELRRRFGWEWNGMRLHELYFGNMRNGELGIKNEELGTRERGEKLQKLINASFGSLEAWEKDFRTAGAMRGIGWVVLAEDKERLFNIWINEHDGGHLAGATPLLVMDVFEHAFMLDYGLKRADYIEAFFKAINWDVVEERL